MLENSECRPGGDILAKMATRILKWTPFFFGLAGAIAKVDRPVSGAAVVDFPGCAVVQRLIRAFIAIEFEIADQSLMAIGS